MMRTLAPAVCAIAVAMFTAVVVLPSPLKLEAIRIVLGECPFKGKVTAVRRRRYSSVKEGGDIEWTNTAGLGRTLPLPDVSNGTKRWRRLRPTAGIVPRVGRCEVAITSSLERTELSR